MGDRYIPTPQMASAITPPIIAVIAAVSLVSVTAMTVRAPKIRSGVAGRSSIEPKNEL